MQLLQFSLYIKDSTFRIDEEVQEGNKYSIELEFLRSKNGNGDALMTIYTMGHVRPINWKNWTLDPSIPIKYDWGAYCYTVSLTDYNGKKITMNGATSYGTQSPSNIPSNVINDILRAIVETIKCHNKEEWIKQTRSTSNNVYDLNRNEIFVFGSDLDGNHIRGAALQAFQKFGAQQGQGDGLQGKSYAIPTMMNSIEAIIPYINKFIKFANNKPCDKFLVTKIGCGLAGFSPTQIAPLFVKAIDVPNIYLPRQFWEIIFED